ncbi:hypothetical protein TEA_023908 [Camellia sinensis var. sinensis]|uniref:C3H1-type domain-containing protein n=1 Tax=Camellia sinensis var. sinensis TaxID=542762 RepID=A0A4S4EBH5_CAMSN|nr:hypothetical protein TEA_023908 [Camellia sinensis var. sinensis]
MWRETDMETFEANSIFALKQTSQSELGFASSDSVTHFTTTQSQSTLDSDCFTDESLSQKFENIGLRSNEDESSNESHPLRPYAEDCPFFLRTRTCKFGLNCKFNHPVRRTNQKAGKEKEKDTGKAKEGFSEKPEQTECKNYLTPGGCKYGKSCRYNHSKDESEIAPPELNFLGRERVGGTPCWATCEMVLVDMELAAGASQPAQASWSSQMPSDKAVPYQDNHSSCMPTMHVFHQEAPKWNEYQAPNFAEERIGHSHSAPAARSFTKKTDIFSRIEEFPERPGQPECSYFMKTGDCKFKSACRYHHPKNQAPKEDCVLSDNGLPLRPGRKICRNYDQFGICKYGRLCLFDHPVNHSSTVPVGSVLESPQGGNSWRDYSSWD